MACETCRTLVRAATTRAVVPRAPQILSAAPTRRYISGLGSSSSSVQRRARQPQTPPSQQAGQARHFSQTRPAEFLKSLATDTSQPYFVVAATERLFKVCGAQASYTISAAARKEGVSTLEDGEEVGTSTAKGSIWHESAFSHFLRLAHDDDDEIVLLTD